MCFNRRTHDIDGPHGFDVVQEGDDLTGILSTVVELDVGHFQGAVLEDRVPSERHSSSSVNVFTG